MTRILEGLALLLLAFHVALRFCVSSGSAWGLTLLIETLPWLAAAFWLCRHALGRRWAAWFSGVEIPLAALGLLAVSSIPRASYMLPAVEGAAAFATYALLVPLCANLFAQRRPLLLGLLNASLLALALYALLQRFWILPALDRQEGLALEACVWTRLYNREVWATFFYPNSFGGFLAILLPVAAGSLIDAPNTRTRALLGAAVALGTLALAFTGSTGAWGAAAAGAVLFVALLWRRRAVMIACAAVLLIGVTALVPFVLRHESMEARATYWRAAARIATQHPILGVGLNNFGEHYYRNRDARPYETQRAHNDYLQLWTELGLLGLIAYLAFLAATARASLRAADPPAEGGPTSRGWIIGGIACAILSAVALRGIFLEAAPLLIVPLVAGAWIGSFSGLSASWGPATRSGLLAGLLAGAAHSVIDFDLYDYGAGTTLFLVAGLAATGRPVELKRRWAIAAAGGTALIALPILLFAVPRFQFAEETRDHAQAVRANPLDADLWVALAQDRVDAGDVEGAEEAFRKAGALRPLHSPYPFKRALALERFGRLAQARESYARALELYPTRASNHYALARLLDRLGELEPARHHYRHALDLDRLAPPGPMRLPLPQRLRALARVEDHAALVALLRGAFSTRELRDLPAALEADYDALVKPALDRALAELLSR